MDESPGEGSDIVEELEGGFGSGCTDGTCTDEQLEMCVDLFGRGVRDSEVVNSISP